VSFADTISVVVLGEGTGYTSSTSSTFVYSTVMALPCSTLSKQQ